MSEDDQRQRSAGSGGGGNASVWNASVNIIKSGMGTGVLFMPYAFSKCGVTLSIVLMIVMGFLAFYAWSKLCLVIRVLEERRGEEEGRKSCGGGGRSFPPLTLESAAGIVFGERGKQISVGITLVFIYGTSIGYAIFILQSMQQYIASPIITLGILAAVYLPLSMMEEIEKLGNFSQLGLASLTLAIIAILIRGSQTIVAVTAEGYNKSSMKQMDISEIPLYFGVFAFAYDINGVVTEVHASMKEKHKFDTVLIRFIMFSFVLGTLVGIVGYGAFGESVNSVIFKNFPSSSSVFTIVSCLFSFSLISSILLYGFPIVKAVDRKLDELSIAASVQRKFLVRIVFFVSICLQAIYVKSVMNVFNLLGSVFSVILTFIIPILLLEKMQDIENGKAQLNVEGENGVYIELEMQETRNRIIQYKQQANDSRLKATDMTRKLNKITMAIGVIGGLSGIISSVYDMISS